MNIASTMNNKDIRIEKAQQLKIIFKRCYHLSVFFITPLLKSSWAHWLLISYFYIFKKKTKKFDGYKIKSLYYIGINDYYYKIGSLSPIERLVEFDPVAF